MFFLYNIYLKNIFIQDYFLKYQASPTPESLIIDIDEKTDVDQQLVSDATVLIREIKQDITENSFGDFKL